MPNESGAIIAHYLRQLAQRSGLRWTTANDRDMQRLAELLGDGEAADTIPPYQPERERTTVVLEQPADPRFEAWRRRRADDESAVGRMTSRNGGAR